MHIGLVYLSNSCRPGVAAVRAGHNDGRASERFQHHQLLIHLNREIDESAMNRIFDNNC